MNRLQQLTMERLALKLEMEASDKLLEAAHMKNSGMDIMHLEQHGVLLLKRWQRATAQMHVELRKTMFPEDA